MLLLVVLIQLNLYIHLTTRLASSAIIHDVLALNQNQLDAKWIDNDDDEDRQPNQVQFRHPSTANYGPTKQPAVLMPKLATLVDGSPSEWLNQHYNQLQPLSYQLGDTNVEQQLARENKMYHLFDYIDLDSKLESLSYLMNNNNSDDHESNDIDSIGSDAAMQQNSMTMMTTVPYYISPASYSVDTTNGQPFEGIDIQSISNDRWPSKLSDDGASSSSSDTTNSNSRHYNNNNHYKQQVLGQNTILSNSKSKFVPSSSHSTFANNFNFNYIHSLLTKPSGGSSSSSATPTAHYHAKLPASSLIVSNLLQNGGGGGGGSQNNLVLPTAPQSAASSMAALNHADDPPTSISNHQNVALLSSYLLASVNNNNNDNLLPSTLGIANQLAQQMPPVAPTQKLQHHHHHQHSASSILIGDQEQQQQQQQQYNSSISGSQIASVGDFPGSSSCGRQQFVSAYREPRIVGGNSTYEGEFPWAVSIQRHGNHHCGGVIVGRRWILTAAHCVRSQLVGNLLVRTGGSTLARSANSLTSHLERDYSVEQIVMHEDFSRYDNLTASQMKSSANTNNADIALLKLKHDIYLDEFAWPVCFPNKEASNFSGHDAIVIGWGKLNEKSDDFSNELQKVKLTIIDNRLCQNWFRQAGREMPIDERIICAGFKNGGKDACHGDSGGPLLSRINGQYVVVGVVSTGIGCARPLLPGLYSRVSSYIGWLEKYITN